MRKVPYLVLLLFMCSAPRLLASGIITSGGIREISVPASVESGALENNAQAVAFREQEAFVIKDALKVDLLASPGIFDSADDFAGGTVTGMVDSYLLHADTVSGNGHPIAVRRYTGTLTFPNPIVGVVAFGQTFLETTDLRASQTEYPSRHAWQDDLDPEPLARYRDSFILSDDLKSLSFDFRTEQRSDQMRILTAVPEPSASLLMLVGGVAMYLCRRQAARTCFSHI